MKKFHVNTISHVCSQLGFLSNTSDVLNFIGKRLGCLHSHDSPALGAKL